MRDAQRELRDLFIRALADDFAKGGAGAIDRVASEHPDSFLDRLAEVRAKRIDLRTWLAMAPEEKQRLKQELFDAMNKGLATAHAAGLTRHGKH